METNRTLFVVNKTDAEKTKIILNNTLVMLNNRIYIDKDGNKQPLIFYDEASKAIEDKGDGTHTLKTNNGDNYAIKIVFQKISAIGKQSIIREFFKDYIQYKKIIIARDYNNKILDYVSRQHTQIFREASLLSNIIDYRDIPKFEVLTPSEAEEMKKEYNVVEYTIKKMLRSDPISKYYALKKGDIVRIIRPTPTSGRGIDYRIVI